MIFLEKKFYIFYLAGYPDIRYPVKFLARYPAAWYPAKSVSGTTLVYLVQYKIYKL